MSDTLFTLLLAAASAWWGYLLAQSRQRRRNVEALQSLVDISETGRMPSRAELNEALFMAMGQGLDVERSTVTHMYRVLDGE